MTSSTGTRLSALSTALRVLTLASALASSDVWAGDFPNGWRGGTSGVWPDSKTPIQWDGPSGKNIRWKIELPSHSIASPVFGPDRLLALSEPDRVQCYALADGKLLWEDRLSAIDVVAPEAERHAWREKFAAAWLLFHHNDPYFSGGLIQVQRIGDETKRKRCESLFSELKKVQLDPPLGWDVCGYTAATPVATADRVIVRHCSNVICCYDWNGKRLWLARPKPGNDPKRYGGSGSLMEFSPLQIVDDLVICNWIPTLDEMGLKRGDTVTYLNNNASTHMPAEKAFDNKKGGPRGYVREALVAFDLVTGKAIWRSDWLRSGGAMSYAFVPMTVDGVRLIVTGGGEVVRAKDGKVVLRDLGWGGYANCPVVAKEPATGAENLLVWCEGQHWYAPRCGQWVYVQRIVRQGDGFAAEKIWEWGWGAGIPGSHHPRSPVIGCGKIFLGDHLGCVFDCVTGKMLYGPKTRPDDKGRFADFRGSLLTTSDYLNPLIAGRYLYLPKDDGSVQVAMADLDAKGQPVMLHHNLLNRAATKDQPYTAEERRNCQTVATPNVWQNCLYIRTQRWLWCIGDSAK